jgi:hypothetical protein
MNLILLTDVEPLTRESYIRTNWIGDYDPDNFPPQNSRKNYRFSFNARH